MHLTMIAAMTRNRVIGTGSGKIPWHLPRDTKHFRDFTNGKHLVLGRVTFEEMSGWFTNQTPIVLTRDKSYTPDHGLKAGSIDEAISEAAGMGAEEIAVCGGAEVYSEALPYADELFLTLIDASIEGGAYFPDYEDGIEWEEINREAFPSDDENEYAMTFLHLRRVHPSSLRPPRLHRL